MPKSKAQKREEAIKRLEENILHDERVMKSCKDPEQAAAWKEHIARTRKEVLCIRGKLLEKKVRFTL